MLTLACDVLMDAVMPECPHPHPWLSPKRPLLAAIKGPTILCDDDPKLLKLQSGRLNSACKGIISDRDFVKSFLQAFGSNPANSQLVPFTLL